jgi:CubicO group peptidase (beta-lactamase class C family)
VSPFKKFLSVALITGSFFNANGLCRAGENFPRIAKANSNTNANANDNANANATNADVAPVPDVDARLDRLIATRVKRLQIPGYALGIIHNGKVVFKKGYGTTDFDNGSPVTSQTVFGLASITKTFTAVALLALVDQGKINLDDSLDKYLDGLAKSWRSITIRQLASMSGGILKSLPKETVWSEQFKRVQEQPLLSTPGSEYLYSNYSYRTLGSVIEKVTGKKYLEVVREIIIDPLGMTSTGTQLSAPAGTLASPYMQQDGAGAVRKLQPYRNPDIPYSAGMLFSNVDDMLTYAQALMDKKILSPAGYKTLWVERPPLSTGKPCDWAFGWRVSSPPAFGQRKMVAMTGGVPGIASSILIFPDEKIAVVSLSNLRKKPVYKIIREVAQVYMKEEGAGDAGEEDASEAETGGVPMVVQ